MNEGFPDLTRRHQKCPEVHVARNDDPIVLDRPINDLRIGRLGKTQIPDMDGIVAIALQLLFSRSASLWDSA